MGCANKSSRIWVLPGISILGPGCQSVYTQPPSFDPASELRASCSFPSGSRLLPARFSEFARNPEDPTLAALGLLGYSSLSAGTSALEISSRNARVQALQKRWDRLRAGLDLVLDQWGADTSDLPWGASGLLVRGYKGKKSSARWPASSWTGGT